MFEICVLVFFWNFCYLLPQSNIISFTCAESLCPLSLKEKNGWENWSGNLRWRWRKQLYCFWFWKSCARGYKSRGKKEHALWIFPISIMRSKFGTDVCLFAILCSGIWSHRRILGISPTAAAAAAELWCLFLTASIIQSAGTLFHGFHIYQRP